MTRVISTTSLEKSQNRKIALQPASLHVAAHHHYHLERNKQLFIYGSTLTISITSGLHLILDRWLETDTWSGVSTAYLMAFITSFACILILAIISESPMPNIQHLAVAPKFTVVTHVKAFHVSWLGSVVAALWFPFSPNNDFSKTMLLWIAPVLYLKLGICMSAVLHRFVSHRAFEPRNRVVQFILCCLGCLAGQGSPLWWGALHVKHHKYCDTLLDPHTPVQFPFWYAFFGWTLFEQGQPELYLEKLNSFPELRLLHRYYYLVFVSEYAAVWYFSSSLGWMIYASWLPSTLCAWFTLLFNVRAHTPPLANKVRFTKTACRAFNLVDLGAWFVGESAHMDHHHDPKAPYRNTDMWFGSFDFPYFVFIKPLQLLGWVTFSSQKGEARTVVVTLLVTGALAVVLVGNLPQ